MIAYGHGYTTTGTDLVYDAGTNCPCCHGTRSSARLVLVSNLPAPRPRLPDPEKIAKALAASRERSIIESAFGVRQAAKAHARAPPMAPRRPKPLVRRPTKRRTCTAVRNFR